MASKGWRPDRCLRTRSLSTLGALCIANAAASEDRKALFNKLMIWGLSMSVVGAIVSRDVFGAGHANTSELVRWDDAHQARGEGTLDDLIVAAVRAAVEAPEQEVRSWFAWRPDTDRLVAEGRLLRRGLLLSTP